MRLEPQFDTVAKQEHALRLGMWLFLGSELLLFGGLFGLYAAYRSVHGADFASGIHHNALALGTTNTIVLIVSSFTVAWAVHAFRASPGSAAARSAAQRRGETIEGRRTALLCLAITLVLGATFLAIKAFEYRAHVVDGALPGHYYAFAELPASGARLFFTLYWLMTGLHALHMIAGIAVMSWLASRIARRRMQRDYFPELELGALYWHLVDAIWIFLWPLFYLTA